jgi:hypothetical protein
MTRARDLSRLANNSALSADSNGNVGVGSTQPKSKLNVVGVVSATSFYGDGTNLSNTGSTLSAASGSQRVVLTSLTSGTMTASSTDANVTYNATTQTLSVPNVSIAGTLTYEDVTNVDSVGLITARNGAIINAGTATTALIVSGNARVTGVVTATSFSGDGSALTGVGGTADVRTNSLVVTGVATITNGPLRLGDSTWYHTIGSAAGNTELFITANAGQGNATTAPNIVFRSSTSAGAITERARIDSSGRLLVGATSAPTGANSQYARQVIRGNTFDSASTARLTFQFGSAGSSLSAGGSVGDIFFTDSSGNDYASIIGARDTSTTSTGRLVFSTTADGQSAPGEAMRITSLDNPQGSSYDRAIWMSSGNAPDENETAWKLYVRGSTRFYSDGDYTPTSTRKGQYEFYSWSGSSGSNSNTWSDQKSGLYVRGWLEGGNPGEAASVLLLNGDWSGATNPGRLIKGYQKASTLVFFVNYNGDVRNTNNSYGAISDEKLKQDIVDSESQWNDIKNLRVRKFKFKKDVEELGNEAPTMLGVVAQEAELVSPGLVDTPGSYDEEGTEDQNLMKTVKYSVLYMKAVKALQEAQERIETLETVVSTLTDRVSALESN